MKKCKKTIKQSLSTVLCVVMLLSTASCGKSHDTGMGKTGDVQIRIAHSADKILQELEDVEVVSVFIGADIDYRVKRFIESGQASDGKNIRRMIERRDRERASYYNYLGDGQWGKASNYTMCFSSDKISKEKICDIVCAYVNTL